MTEKTKQFELSIELKKYKFDRLKRNDASNLKCIFSKPLCNDTCNFIDLRLHAFFPNAVKFQELTIKSNCQFKLLKKKVCKHFWILE